MFVQHFEESKHPSELQVLLTKGMNICNIMVILQVEYNAENKMMW